MQGVRGREGEGAEGKGTGAGGKREWGRRMGAIRAGGQGVSLGTFAFSCNILYL